MCERKLANNLHPQAESGGNTNEVQMLWKRIIYFCLEIKKKKVFNIFFNKSVFGLCLSYSVIRKSVFKLHEVTIYGILDLFSVNLSII